MSAQHATNDRLTARQRESSERRILTIQRRRELTNRIRKEKKSIYLQRKRGLPFLSAQYSVTDANRASMPAKLKEVLESYCQNRLQVEQLLSTLHHFVSSASNVALGASGLQETDNPLVLEQNDESFALIFLDHLRQKTVESLCSQDASYFQAALRILVHLTSICSSNYTLSSTTSNELDYYRSRPLTWTELLVSPSIVSTSSAYSTSSTPSWLEIFVQSLLSSREVELTSLVLGNLVGDDGETRNIFQAVSDDLKTSLVAGLIRSVSSNTPTAAWTLTNMIRNDSVSYARTYCSETLLSSSLLLTWLQEPALVTQTAWIIDSLTTREEETIDYLCEKHSCKQEKEFPLLSAIIESIENPLQPDQTVPLMQALANIASHASWVPPLLSQTSPPIIPLLQKILSTTPSRDPVLTQGASLASCLLVDVGVEYHPSTTVAAPALIPILIDRLNGVSQNRGRSSQLMARMALEEEREFASALWNALEKPPTVNEQQGQRQPSFINHNLRSPSVKLPCVLNTSRSTLRSLVRLINSNDSDAVLSGVHVINLLLRQASDLQYLQTITQEEALPDALEQVCDSPMEEAANVAAEVLDDFFYNEDYDDTVETRDFSSWTNGLPTSTSYIFGIDLDTQVASGLGRGRGRGATIPAWMTK